MRKVHALQLQGLDFSSQIQRHSGDETVTYQVVDGQDIHLSYFYPDPMPNCLKPALILVHGGGWSNHKIFSDQGNLWQGDYLGYLARYYADHGYVCVSIDYRLSREGGQCPDYQLIDCYEDCAKAMDYILSTASAYHIDIDRVSLLGESAGGHLAGMLATCYHHDDFHFQTAFLFNPILDFENCPTWITQIPEQTTNQQLQTMSFVERVRFLSPITHIHPDMCSTVLIHGMEDKTVGLYHSDNFYKKMLDMNLSCDLHLIEGTSHAFLLAEYTKNVAATQIGVSILNSYLLQRN